MRRGRRLLRRILLYAAVLLSTVVAVVVGVRLTADRTTALDRFKNGGVATIRPRPTTPIGPVPAPGQSFVTGTADTLSAEGAQASPIPTPFTLSAVERGTGRATIANALVDGKRTSIVWPGGTPLPITGDGSIDLAGSRVDVDPGGATWKVDGSARSLRPGRYRAGAPVAVGVGGLATPRDAVDFTADAMTLVQSTGGVVIKVPPGPLDLAGPGKVTAAGQLQVRDSRTTKPATSVGFGEGPYKVTITTAGGRLSIDAVLQGPVTSS